MGRPGVVRDAAAAFAARSAELPPDADPAGIERLWAEELAGHADKAPRTLKRITSEHYRPAVLHALGTGHSRNTVKRYLRSGDVAAPG